MIGGTVVVSVTIYMNNLVQIGELIKVVWSLQLYLIYHDRVCEKYT